MVARDGGDEGRGVPGAVGTKRLGNNRLANRGLNPTKMPPKSALKPPVKTSKWPTNKTKAKQPLPAQEVLKRLFTSLCAQIDGGHFANAVKTCDKSMFILP